MLVMATESIRGLREGCPVPDGAVVSLNSETVILLVAELLFPVMERATPL